MKHDDQHCTLIAWSKQPFFWVDPQWSTSTASCSSTSTASCSTRSFCTGPCNTKWYEAWLERTLLLDPIIFDMWIPGVLSWAPGQPCNSHHSRHTGQDTVVVPYLRCVSFLNQKSVGGRGCGQQPDAFFPLPELPRRRGESLVGVRVHHSCWLSLTPVVTYAATCSVIEHVASAPVVFHAAPATLIERNALYTSGQEHEQHL